MVPSKQHFYHFAVYQGVTGGLAGLCGSVYEIWDWPLVQGSILVGFLNRVNVMVSGGYIARSCSEQDCCLPDTSRLCELGIKKSGSAPASAPCPALGLIAKSHSWLLAGNAGSRIFRR